MRSIEQIKSTLKDKIESEGIDTFRAVYSTAGVTYIIIFSWGRQWEHASISVVRPKRRIPTWEEMCMFKDMFWQENECVMQLHPPKQDYINNCKYCLHLWRPIDKSIPIPPKILV